MHFDSYHLFHYLASFDSSLGRDASHGPLSAGRYGFRTFHVLFVHDKQHNIVLAWDGR